MQLYALLIQRHLAVSGGKILARNSLFGEDNFGQAGGGGHDRKKILRRIWIQPPTRTSRKRALVFNPMCLREGDVEAIEERLRDILD